MSKMTAYPLYVEGDTYVMVADHSDVGGPHTSLWDRGGVLAAYRRGRAVHSHRLHGERLSWLVGELALVWARAFDPAGRFPVPDEADIHLLRDDFTFTEESPGRFGRSEIVTFAVGYGYRPDEYFEVARQCHLDLLSCTTRGRQGDCSCKFEVAEESRSAGEWFDRVFLPAPYRGGWHGPMFVIRDQRWWDDAGRRP